MTRLRRLRSTSETGQIIVLFALSLVVVLSAVAVILDGGRVYAERRKTQNAADAAAMAGAAVLDKSNPTTSLPTVLAKACDAAFRNGGFGTGSPGTQCGLNGTDVNVHVPGGDGFTGPLAGVLSNYENPGYVQVEIRSSFKSFMSGLLGLADFGASARAVAVNIPGNALGDVLLVLDPTTCGALTLSGSNTLNVSGGNVMVDSNAARTAGPVCANKNAVVQSGGGGINNTSGANNVVGNPDVNSHLTPAFISDVPYEPDPLTRVTVPPFDSTAPHQAGPGTYNAPAPWTAMGTATASPGVYWGGITVTTGDTLTLSAGTYIMAGGGFSVQGGTVTGTGVTIIYTMDRYCNSSVGSPPSGCDNTAQNNGNLDGSHMNGSSSQTGQQTGNWGTQTSALTPQTLAPGSDPYNLNNILIYVDRNAVSQVANDPPCPATTLVIGGNGYFNFANGSIVYAPCAMVDLHGTSDPNSHGGAVVSWQLVIDGTKDMDLGGPAIGGGPTAQSNLVQ